MWVDCQITGSEVKFLKVCGFLVVRVKRHTFDTPAGEFQRCAISLCPGRIINAVGFNHTNVVSREEEMVEIDI